MSSTHLLACLEALAVATTTLACGFSVSVQHDAPIDAEPADADLPLAIGSTMLAASSLAVDLVARGDGAITTDGLNDGVFDVELIGPVAALTLLRTDAAGTSVSNQQWDTWVGADRIPAGLGTVFVAGSATYQLGVYDAGGGLLNDASGRLALPASRRTVRIAGANVGSFVAGNYFRVVAESPTGVLVYGPIVTY